MPFQDLIGFLPVSTHFLHMRASSRGAAAPTGWNARSQKGTEDHIRKITQYEHFSKDFIPHASVGSMKLRMNALGSGFGSGIDGQAGGMDIIRNHPTNI
eukprot:CAMPEP_0179420094 /NCGR_PEP_ID=MMETSP0799-20121207/8976_1 /TAXON_ID=46947 /ORGANISM="Geminigera cryophila, Strain CCMP2564" /LENGTH=98 /DNA_ID=CAMNT_0021193665 /DNA_START=6 /DNA_END=302 /DNA_ORIENTATION=+